MSTENEIKAGDEVLSYCGKCKKPTNHIISSVTKTDTPDRCECQICKALHKYRDPEKVAKKGKSAAKKEKRSSEDIWKEALATAGDDVSKYAMSGDFIEGQLINHATFGKGIVMEVIGGNKIKVIFEEAEKILVHNR